MTIFLVRHQDKFGDILANNGARMYGVFDELLSFFASFNMVSSKNSKVSDSREYQEFLTLYNGTSKRRQTSK